MFGAGSGCETAQMVANRRLLGDLTGRRWQVPVAILEVMAIVAVLVIGFSTVVLRSLPNGDFVDLGPLAQTFVVRPTGTQVVVTVGGPGPWKPGARVPVGAGGLPPGTDVLVAVCTSLSMEGSDGCQMVEAGGLRVVNVDSVTGAMSTELTAPAEVEGTSCADPGSCVIVVGTPARNLRGPDTPPVWGIAPFQTTH